MFVVIEKFDDNVNVFQLHVKQGEPSLVTLIKETKKGMYFFSNLDQNIVVIIQTIYRNEKSGEAIKNILEKVVIHNFFFFCCTM